MTYPARTLVVGLTLLATTLGYDLFSHDKPSKLTSADVGNWTVGECILAQFALELTLPNVTAMHKPLPKNGTFPTYNIDVPVDAKADKGARDCGNDTQILSLDWTETALNASDVQLFRNLTIVFNRLNKNVSSIPGYGVRRIYGMFEVARFQDIGAKNETLNISSYFDLDSGDLGNGEGVMFRVPVGRSFSCMNLGDDLSLATNLHYSYDDAPSRGHAMPNATVAARNVEFDAFRTADSPPHMFSSPMDCAYSPTDVVPIAVGVALAALVVLVLIAYFIGRRRQRQRGYESV